MGASYTAPDCAGLFAGVPEPLGDAFEDAVLVALEDAVLVALVDAALVALEDAVLVALVDAALVVHRLP